MLYKYRSETIHSLLLPDKYAKFLAVFVYKFIRIFIYQINPVLTVLNKTLFLVSMKNSLISFQHF